jgi:hypothetical protein
VEELNIVKESKDGAEDLLQPVGEDRRRREAAAPGLGADSEEHQGTKFSAANKRADWGTAEFLESLRALGRILGDARVGFGEHAAIKGHLAEAKEAALKEELDKGKVIALLVGALRTAKSADNIDKLTTVVEPHLLTAAKWLGEDASTLLSELV